MRRTLVSRSSREKPRPLERWVRTSSPSRTSTWTPRWRSSAASMAASVLLPAPERPVNQTTKPLIRRSSDHEELGGDELSRGLVPHEDAVLVDYAGTYAGDDEGERPRRAWAQRDRAALGLRGLAHAEHRGVRRAEV